MNEFFSNQLDYILFFYGLAFVLLAVICVYLARRKTAGLSWKCMAYFAALHGGQEWIGIISGGYFIIPWLETARTVLSVISFLPLFEFGLRGLPAVSKKGWDKLVYLPLLLIMTVGAAGGLEGVNATSRYSFGLAGGLMAAAVLFRTARQETGKGARWLIGASLSLVIYAILTALFVKEAGIWPASVFNSGTFASLTGMPVQFAKGLLAVCVGISIWGYSQTTGRQEDESAGMPVRRDIVLPAVLFIGLVAAGWGITIFAGRQAKAIEVRDGNVFISAMGNHLVDELGETEQMAMDVAGSGPVITAMSTLAPADIEAAGRHLRNAGYSQMAESYSVYIVAASGKTMNASGQDTAGQYSLSAPVAHKSFLQAMRGAASSHYAVDLESRHRYYISYAPVHDKEERVIGVAIVAKDMNDIEAGFKKQDYFFLIDPNGVIFLSSKHNLHGNSLWPLTPDQEKNLAASGQFDPGPFTPLLKERRTTGSFVTLQGRKLLVTQRSLGHDNWSLILLAPTNHIRAYRLFSIFSTLVFFGITTFFFAVLHMSRNAAAKIADSERHYRSLVEGSPNCVALFSDEGRCLSINRSGMLQTGLSAQELVGSMIYDIWPDNSGASVKQLINQVLKGMRCSYESQRMRADGRPVIWMSVLNPTYDNRGRISRFVGIFTDITERKLAEAELKRYHDQLQSIVEDRTKELSDTNQRLRLEVRERIHAEDARRDSEQRFQTLFNMAADGIFLLDPSGTAGPIITDMNMAAASMNGYTVQEMIGKPITFLNHPDDQVLAKNEMVKLNAGETVKFEIRHIRKDGGLIPLEVCAREVQLGNRKYILAIDRDITERKQAEEELCKHRDQLEQLVGERTGELKTAVQLLTNEINFRKSAEETLKESESKFRRLSQEFNALLNAITDELLLISPELNILWANEAFAKRIGRKTSELSGLHCHTFWFNSDDRCEECTALKCFKTGQPENFPVASSNGIIFDRRAFPIKDEAGVVQSVIIIAADITEKTNLHAEAMRTGHLASIGELSAGVAHEINNPITGIINYAQILVNKNPEDSREHDIAKRIVREGERIAGIVRNLLSFARERREDKAIASFEKILCDSITLTEAQLKKDGINLILNFPEQLPGIWVNSQQIQQVILNLISNARYALNHKYPEADEDKILEVAGSNATIDDIPFVKIVFCDHGSGIPAEIIEKVMNPFFSTKPVGEGTGLGLSISHGIISNHNGRIRIESSEGKSTSIILYLPAWKNDA